MKKGIVLSLGTIICTAAIAQDKMAAEPAIAGCSKAQQDASPAANSSAHFTDDSALGATLSAPERQLYLDAARTSWNLVNRITEPSTGLARAHADYSYVTVWDMTGAIAAKPVDDPMRLRAIQKQRRPAEIAPIGHIAGRAPHLGAIVGADLQV